MGEIITEKDYPIQLLWVFKTIISLFPIVIILILSLFFSISTGKSNTRSIIYLILYPGVIILFVFGLPLLQRLTFHYSIEDKFLILKQGIFSKQQRHIPYGVIQNLFIKQDLFDRIFGLASLTIENASQGAGALANLQGQRTQMEIAGFIGNKINIPGLAKQNAEILKEIVLQKMKENPIEDSQSGL